MDWSNEPYVKVYTRETDDDLALSWEARAVWDALIKRFDRSGRVDTKRGARGLAAIVRIPAPVVERVLPELLEDGRLRAVAGGYIAPNFMTAQDARKSDKLRQRESRERRRADSLTVTISDEDERIPVAGVTHGHEASPDVTLCSADPDPRSLADPKQSVATRARAIPPTTTPTPPGGTIGRLAVDAWSYAAARHLAVRSELEPTAVPWTAIPTGEGKNELLERVRELVPDPDQADLETATATLRRAVDVAEAEARAATPPTLRWFIPSRLFSSQSFWRCAEQSPEQVVSRPDARTKSGAGGAGTTGFHARANLSITDDEQRAAIRVLAKFDERLDTHYADSDAHRELVVRRLREGRDEMDLRKVLAYLAEEQGWLESPKMRGHLIPETVFKPEQLDKYAQPARAWFEKQHGTSDRKPAMRAPVSPAFGLRLVHTEGGGHGQ